MKKLLFILLAVASLGSCSDDKLDLIPKTSVTGASFFKNATEYNQALTGAYVNLRGIAYMGAFMDEMRSDNTFFTYYSADRGTASTEAMATFIDTRTTSQELNSPGERYQNDFSGIAKVNTILSRIAGSPLTQADKDQVSGEALFLRAFYYYDLVQHYGGVPLQLQEVNDVAGAFLPRSSTEETYAQVIADLQAAIPLLPVATTFPQTGRATRGAAKMLLAYAYMSKPTREYAKAEAELLDITRMNYRLLDDYASVFDPANKNNQESIFEVQYKAGNEGQQSDFIWRFIPKTTNSEVILGLAGNNSGGGLATGGWNVPTQEMVESYEPDDLRLPASIAVAEGTVADEVLTATAVKSPVNYVPTPGVDYYYFIKKYLHPPYQVQFNTNDNWPVFRYSGALLLLAECLVAESKAAQALPYLNDVRKRAGLDPLIEATKQNVADEMRHELAFENHRWTDLIRNDMAVDVITAKGVTMKALYGFLLPTTFQINTNRLVYAIPFRETLLNTGLEQNFGY